MILQPLTVNSYWTDTNGDGVKEWVADPPPEDSWWEDDSDGDLMTNAEEALYGSDPYRIDSDFDGLTDRDERDLTPPMIDGVTPTDPWLWDSDSDGYSDYDEFYNWLQGRPLQVNYASLPAGYSFFSYYDADGDGIHNPEDTYPLDRDNDGIMDHEDAWPDDPNNNNGNQPQDDDQDGLPNDDDSHPIDPNLWSDWNDDGDNDDGDGDEDGYTISSDSHPRNPSLWCDFNGDGINDAEALDSDMDTVVDANDSHPSDPSLWSDWNGDGDNNDEDGDEDGHLNAADTHPQNPSLWCDYDGDGFNDPEYLDSDGDTWMDAHDSHPQDASLWSDWNGDGDNNDGDSDEDDRPNSDDSHPRNPYLWNDWNNDGDNNDDDGDEDGFPNGQDSHPRDATLWSDWDWNGINNDEDSDEDGWVNSNDSHPQNNSLWTDWNGDDDNNDTDGDEDSHANEHDSHPRYNSLWSDWNDDGDNNDEDGDEDGRVNNLDSHPRDGSLWTDWDGNGENDDNDLDGDDHSNGDDSHPEDISLWSDWNNDGDNSETDGDEDGIANEDDSNERDASLWSDWNHDGTNNDVDGDEDGYANGDDSHPRNPALFTDTDDDGHNIGEDSHPNDPAWWNDWDQDGVSDFDQDNDFDGLSNYAEAQVHGTDPNNVDTDSDYLTDYEELLIFHTNPLAIRSASGQVQTDFYHVQATQPTAMLDGDNDGIPNAVERWFGLDPQNPADAAGTIGGGTMTNLERYQAGVSLLAGLSSIDADDDGITDAMEDYYNAMSPGVLSTWRFSDAVEDPDGDGVNNFDEVRSGLNLLDAHTLAPAEDYTVFVQRMDLPHTVKGTGDGDADNDIIPDLWEHRYRSLTSSASAGMNLHNALDAGGNLDGDFYNNIQEYQTGSHPLISDANATVPTGPATPDDPYQNNNSVLSPGIVPATGFSDSSTSGNFSFAQPFGSLGEGQDPPDDAVTWHYRIVERDRDYQMINFPDWKLMRGRVKVSFAGPPVFCQADPNVPLTQAGQICGCQHGTANRFVSGWMDSPDGLNGQILAWDSIHYTMQNPPQSMVQGYCDKAYYAMAWTKTPEVYVARQAASANEVVRSLRVKRSPDHLPWNTWDLLLKIPENETDMMHWMLHGGLEWWPGFSYGYQLNSANASVTLIPDGGTQDGNPQPSSVSDAAGPRYRKVGLNGIPMPDAKPQVQNENGEEEEETYIDAFSAQIRHSVSDVYVTDEGTLLPLTVRRDVASDAWNDRHGLHPDERPNQPFGPGWQSNICSHIRFDFIDENITADVVDESGGGQRFVYSGLGNWQHDGQESRDIKSFMNRLETSTENLQVVDDLTYMTFSNIRLIKKFGTICEYEMLSPAGLRQLYRQDRMLGMGSYVTHLYGRLTKVTDRMGNELVYEYPPNSTTLIPSRIYDPARPGHQILIQESDGRITAVRGPGGDLITYEYDLPNVDALPGINRGDGIPSVLTRVKKNTGGTDVVHYAFTASQVKVEEHHPEDDEEESNFDKEWNGVEVFIKPTVHTNLELTSITDERGAQYTFAHARNYSVASFDGEKMRQLWSQPMFLTSVTSPLIGTTQIRVTDLDGDEFTKTNLRLGTGLANQSAPGVRTSFTSPGTTLPYLYEFSMPEAIPPMGLSTQADHTTMGYKKMTITTPEKVVGSSPDFSAPTSGVETYFYDSAEVVYGRVSQNCMLLTCVQDRNGRTTKFTYDDPLPGVPFPYDDPVGEITTELGHPVTKTMTYDPGSRILITTTVQRSVEENDKVQTVYGLDSLKRRTSETVSSLDATIPGGRQTQMVYGIAALPGFVTQETVSPLTADSHVPPVVRTRAVGNATQQPNTWWRTISETVQIGGQNATTTTWSDFNGNKRMVRDARGNVTRFEYDARHRLTRAVHPDGTFKTLAYDTHGNLIRETDELGTITWHVYDALNRRIKSTLDLNRNGVADTRYTQAVNATAMYPLESPYNGDLVTETTYNQLNLPVTQTDGRGVVTKFEYDLLGRLVTKTANWRQTPSTTDPAQTTSYEYKVTGINGGLEAGSTVFDVSGFKPVRVTDPRSNQTAFEYDELYRQVREYRPDNSIIHKTYNDLGQLIKVTDPCDPGATQAHKDYGAVQTEYDALGNPWKVLLPDGAWTETHYTPSGKPWKTRDEFGLWTFVTYSSAGLPLEMMVQVSTTNAALNPKTQTAYDLNGNPTWITDPLGRVTRQVHDARNRPVKTVLPAVVDAASASATPVSPVTVTEYDALGHPVSVTDPLGAQTRTIYDAAGRVVTTFDALDQPSFVTYDAGGQVLTTTNALGQTTTNSYSSLGFLTSTTDAAGIENEFTYDVAGNRTSVKDGRGGTTHFQYDSLNRLSRELFADGVEWYYWHFSPASGGVPANYVDKAGRYGFVINGHSNSWSYDRRHRLVLAGGYAHDPDSPAYSSSAFTYTNGRLVAVEETGPGATPGGGIAETATVANNTYYSYDILGRMTMEASHMQAHTYQYDLVGNRTSSVLACGGVSRSVSTTFDALNRPSTITDNNGTSATSADDKVTLYGYDLAGRALKLNQRQSSASGPRISETVNGYDLLGRLASRELRGTAAMTLQSAFAWSHDALGRVTQQWESWAATASSASRTQTTTMAYDLAGRLNSEAIDDSAGDDITTTYTYDASHNRVGKNVVGGSAPGLITCTFNEANQLTQTQKPGNETVTYSYDTSGNRLSSSRVVNGGQAEVTQYRWNGWDKLIGVQMPDGKAFTYSYDYRSRRVATAQDDAGGLSAQHTAVVFSGGLSVAEFERGTNAAITGSTQPTVQYGRGPDMGGGVGGLLYSQRGSATKYNLSNGRGDVVAQSDGTGALTWTASYEAFGKRTKETGTNADKQRANSKDEDPTGLLNEGFRYRDIETGVWLSRDPAGFVDGPNLYAYVKQNPWSHFDPDGLFLSALMEKFDEHVLTPMGEALGGAIGRSMSADTLTGLSDSKAFAATGTALNATRSASMTALNTLSPFDDAAKQALDGNIKGAFVEAGKEVAGGKFTKAGGKLLKLGGEAVQGLVTKSDNLVASAQKNADEVAALTDNLAPQVAKNKAAGDAARDAIAAERPGSVIEKNFRVTGGLRRTDVLDGTTAIESKVGRTGLTEVVRQELARDIKMLRSGKVEKVEWHFTPSATTGKSGPTGPLREKLNKFKIPIVDRN